MTTLTQTSVIKQHTGWHGRGAQSQYQVVVNAEDGNFEEFELEAASFAEAEEKANAIAYGSMTDITFIEIYKIV